MNKPLIGIMNGRLSPKRNGRFQSFPFETWQREFDLAREVGLDFIEMVFDHEDFEKHPLYTLAGVEQIRQKIKDTGVKVESICADFFMALPLHRGMESERMLSLNVFKTLIENCHLVGVKHIVLPCVDQSTVNNTTEEDLLITALHEIQPLLVKTGLNVGLESDYEPQRLKSLMEKINLPQIGVNYDTGNSAGLGYDVTEELTSYGKYISSVHIKDRKLHGTTVKLGTGDTDFKTFFPHLKKLNYSAHFTIQAARGVEGDEINEVRGQLQFVKKWI